MQAVGLPAMMKFSVSFQPVDLAAHGNGAFAIGLMGDRSPLKGHFLLRLTMGQQPSDASPQKTMNDRIEEVGEKLQRLSALPVQETHLPDAGPKESEPLKWGSGLGGQPLL